MTKQKTPKGESECAPALPETAADNAYQRLKRALMRGHISPGAVLTIRTLARQFGVSAVPVREALIRLQAQGALELSNKGSVQAPMQSIEEFREITLLRKTLEGQAGAEAAARASVEDIAAIASIESGFEEALRERDVTLSLDINEEFHFAIYRAARNATLLRHIELLWLRSGPYIAALYRFFAMAREFPHAAPEKNRFGHKQIIEALKNRDAASAREGICYDIDFTLSQLLHVADRAKLVGDSDAELAGLFSNPAGWLGS